MFLTVSVTSACVLFILRFTPFQHGVKVSEDVDNQCFPAISKFGLSGELDVYIDICKPVKKMKN